MPKARSGSDKTNIGPIGSCQSILHKLPQAVSHAHPRSRAPRIAESGSAAPCLTNEMAATLYVTPLLAFGFPFLSLPCLHLFLINQGLSMCGMEGKVPHSCSRGTGGGEERDLAQYIGRGLCLPGRLNSPARGSLSLLWTRHNASYKPSLQCR